MLWNHPAEIPFARPADSRPALADDRRSLDSAALAQEVLRVAGGLAARGIGPGDVVATMLPNRVELVTAMFAAWRLGAALTPVNPRLTAAEAGHQLGDAAARVVVVDDASAATLAAAGVATPRLHVDRLAALTGAAPAVAHAPGDVALLIYTGGTTGTPKGVVLDHGNVAAMLRANAEICPLDSDDRALVVMPLFHVNGLIVSVCGPLASGAATTIAERFSPEELFARVARERTTLVSLVPAIYLILDAAVPDGAPLPDLSSLRYLFCGAAPIAPAALEGFERRFGVTILEGYGLSECTVSCAVNRPGAVRKRGSVGPAVPGCELAIVDEDDRPLPPGALGEVVVRGPNVMRGYLRRPAETAAALRGGWLHTGDVGRLDEDGHLFLVDRTKDLVIRGGENIYPTEIEAVLATHPGVLEAAVVGRADPLLGEVPVAFVEALADGGPLDAEELRALCELRLTAHKVPVSFTLVPRLPRSAIGKVDKRALRALGGRDDDEPAGGS